MSKHLVIVESPAKSKTISKFLGKDYVIAASYGHVRDLPSTKLGVDIDDNFTPTYSNMKDKAEVLKTLRKLSKEAQHVLIATDPDREGEAIAWHILHAIKLPEEKVSRIVFNEITESALKTAIQSGRDIDMHLVNAQQARRVLDRLIGYKLSPMLSRKIRRGLSAGRVQSVAVKIICDREKEILNFVSEEYWNIDVDFQIENEKKQFSARLFAENDASKKILPSNEKEAHDIVSILNAATYQVAQLKKTESKRKPSPPFITSTLQQEASRKLNWSAKKTMMIAQQLYEGVEVNGEPTGLITYMRTDSIRIANEAQQQAKEFIVKAYGEQYLSPASHKQKPSKKVQDAHEAIRPTYLVNDPKTIQPILPSDHFKLYKLIWDRFLASQMSPSISDRTQVLVKAEGEKTYLLKATGSIVKFDGFTVLYSESQDDKADKPGDLKDSQLPQLTEKEPLTKKQVHSQQKFTQPPPRYTEASLVKEMEEQGIGRPSTYAPTLSTVQDRGYINREKKVLSPSELGLLVNEKLEAFFNQIIDVKFTAGMETRLDEIMEGKHTWQSVVSDYYKPFSEMLDYAYKNMEKVNTDKPSDEICEKCQGPMLIKAGRYGEFLACSNFPDCKNTKSILKELEVDCPKCSQKLLEKKSKRGKVFYGCSSFPKCDYASWDLPLSEACPTCKAKLLFQKTNKKGSYKYCGEEACNYKLEE